jgi:hypothetical protein
LAHLLAEADCPVEVLLFAHLLAEAGCPVEVLLFAHLLVELGLSEGSYISFTHFLFVGGVEGSD